MDDMTNALLNKEQKIAVEHMEGPLLVLAGAGSGKTRIVTCRIAHLIANGIDPERIVAVTFTNKAAEEMRHRIQSLLMGHSDTLPLISTFHSLGAKILRESIHHLGYKNDFSIYDEDDTLKVLKGCLLSLGIKGDANVCKNLKNLISFVKNQNALVQDAATRHDSFEVKNHFEEIYNLYQERLKESNACDFDDLLYLVVRLFKEKKEVLQYYQNKFHFLLIDEYQDTNPAQYLIAKFITEHSLNIFVVGDPDQSIYSWRGANINNILNFEHDYKEAKVVRLEQNYRSKENILQAANHLIQNNVNRFEKKLWSSNGEGEKITLFVGQDDREEADFVCQKIRTLIKTEETSLKEMVIFYRTNFQSRVFEDYLLRSRIPYQIIGGLSFYERKEIKDLLSLLHVLIADNNMLALSRSFLFLKSGIGETSLEKVRMLARERNCSLMQMLSYLASGEESLSRMTERQKSAIKEYYDLIMDLRSLKNKLGLKDLLIATINKSHFIDLLREDKETFEERKANIEELISKAYEWETTSSRSTLHEFLEELALKNTHDDSDEKKDRINLMTVHNGKGLEFSTVFLVGMEEDLFPHVNARSNAQAIEEERRLCYVGMTRAKMRLFFTAAESRFIWGINRTMKPSRFLREIPRTYINKVMYTESF